MSESSTYDILNRIAILHSRSLAAYLHYAKPWAIQAHPKTQAVLEQMVADQLDTVDRLAALIMENGPVDPGEFPISFTGWHDLSVDWLVNKLIERQKRTIALMEQLTAELNLAPYAQAMAREAVGQAKGHLENLQEVAGELQVSPA
ncbi:hypothetical protein [Anatilimnocola floriformis]|uniref:hypothetical protein n=1 Tax=Anatilimnocola floriformis TaxID=2948575 RepID=UPI0020C2F689|nr:hypothetical protein [Anatilimnocola floriformis]